MSNPQMQALSDRTRHFLLSNPGLGYPMALAEKHPRILERIVELHKSKLELREYFDSLTNNERGDRKGFAFEVLIDIQDLREFLLGDVNGFSSDPESRWV